MVYRYKFGNETYCVSFGAIATTRNETDSLNFHAKNNMTPGLKCLAAGWIIRINSPTMFTKPCPQTSTKFGWEEVHVKMVLDGVGGFRAEIIVEEPTNLQVLHV